MSQPLRLGIAGLGAATSQVLPGLPDLKDKIKLTAVADVRKEALEAFAAEYGVLTFDTVEALAACPEVDAIWIATPNLMHAEHTIIAAEHGKHVICEKPMAISLEECRAMIEAVDRNGVKYVQGHSKIYEHPIKQMGAVIQSGELGKVFQIQTSNFNDWLVRPRLASEVDTNQGGGIVFRQGPHHADIIRYLGGGMVESVRAVAGRNSPNFDTEGNYSALLTFEDGPVALMSINGYGHFDVTELTWDIGEGAHRVDRSAKKQRFTQALDAQTKYAMAKTLGHEEHQIERKYQPFFGLTIVSCEKGVMRQSPEGIYVYTEDGMREIPCPSDAGRTAELVELCEAIQQDRPSFPDARWGMASLELCLGMLQSSRENREIKLVHQVPSPIRVQ